MYQLDPPCLQGAGFDIVNPEYALGVGMVEISSLLNPLARCSCLTHVLGCDRNRLSTLWSGFSSGWVGAVRMTAKS